jgi:hypothetical protein
VVAVAHLFGVAAVVALEHQVPELLVEQVRMLAQVALAAAPATAAEMVQPLQEVAAVHITAQHLVPVAQGKLS